MHSDCVFKKEQEACLEKIRRATVLNPMNDSSPGEFQSGVEICILNECFPELSFYCVWEGYTIHCKQVGIRKLATEVN